MWRERGLTMVLVTHDSSVARRAQRIGVMKNGRLGFRQPRPGRAARPQAGRPAAPSAQTAPEPFPGLVPPDVPVYPAQADHPADTEPAGLPGLADAGFEDPEDRDSEPADTITFD
jgi:hypothetical protein